MTNLALIRPHRLRMDEELAAAGFSRGPRGGTLAGHGLTVRVEGNWLVLRTRRRRAGENTPRTLAGQPGLWKAVAEGGGIRHLFEHPLAGLVEALADLDDPHEAVSPLRAVVDWALATVDGHRPPGWTAPPREEIEALIPPGALTVRSGVHARQGALLHKEDRLALRFPVVPTVPDGLAPSRRAWLDRLLDEARARWRMVRVGLLPSRGTAGGSIEAEVDLTGAPPDSLPGLVAVALPALSHAVEWIVAPAVFAANGPESCPALEIPPGRLEALSQTQIGGERE